MLESLQQGLANYGVSIAVTIIGIVAVRYMRKLFLVIEDKFNIDIDDTVEKMLCHMVRKAIRIIYQTFIKDMKKIEGGWNKDTKQEALHKAYDLVKLEADRVGLGKYVEKRNVLNDIESELVNVKDKARSSSNFAK